MTHDLSAIGTPPAQCTETNAHCRCELPAGHHPDAHVCECNGAWDNNQTPILFPQGQTRAEAISSVMASILFPELR